MRFSALGVIIVLTTALAVCQQEPLGQSGKKEVRKMQLQENEKNCVRQWLSEAPFDNPVALAANPNFSYEKWLQKGRELPRVVDVLVEFLHEQNKLPTASGERIAYALGWVGDRRATGELLSALSSKDQVLRAEAAAALGRIGDPAALAPLTKIVEDEKEESNVRANACISLGLLGGNEALAALHKAANGRDAFVSRAAQGALRH